MGRGLCFARTFVSDQKTIWTSPTHLHVLPPGDKNWLAIFGAGTLGLVATDNSIMRHFGSTPIAHSNSFGNYVLGAMSAGVASLYLRGVAIHDEHSRETGFLAGEAVVDGVVVAETLKLAFQRPRPNGANAGSFGAGGASFPRNMRSPHGRLLLSLPTSIRDG